MARIDLQIDWSRERDPARVQRALKILEEHPREALRELKALADGGSIMSMIHLGHAYFVGKGVEIDVAEGIKWNRRAADAGSVLGYYHLARQYLQMKRYEDGRDVLRIAAAKEFPPALRLLGTLYLNGLGVEKDREKAIRHFERAAMGGSVIAKGNLARMLMKKPNDARTRLKGLWLYICGHVELFTTMLTEGLESYKLR